MAACVLQIGATGCQINYLVIIKPIFKGLKYRTEPRMPTFFSFDIVCLKFSITQYKKYLLIIVQPDEKYEPPLLWPQVCYVL